MQILAVADLVRVRIYTSQSNQLGENVLDYTTALPVGGMTDKDLADAYSTGLAPLMKAWLCSTATYRGISLQITRAAQLFVAVTSNLGSGIGTGLADPMPRQVCGITTKLTDLARSANRGRVFWPFPFKDPGDLVGNPTVAQRGLMEAIASQVLLERAYAAGPKSITIRPVIVHKRLPIPLVTPDPTPITGFHTTQKWATQRRRGDFGAPNQFPSL